MKQIIRAVIKEPFLWLFYYFVQPSKFGEQVETSHVPKRATTMLRLALPIFLISYYPLLQGANVGAALLGLGAGILVGTVRGIKWGIVGCFGLGIGLGLGCNFAPSAIIHPSASLVFSICWNLGIGLSIGLGVYGDVLGPSAKRFLRGMTRGTVVRCLSLWRRSHMQQQTVANRPG